MASSEIIQPSFILPDNGDLPVLVYSPFLKCLLNIKNDVLGFLNIDSQTIVKQILTPFCSAEAVALSSDSSLVAVNVRYQFIDLSNTIPAQIRVLRPPNDSTGLNDTSTESSVYIKPCFGSNRITNLNFFPDGSKIIATNTNSKTGPWCKIFTIPEGLWDEDGRSGGDRNNKTLVFEEIDVFKQGFPLPDDRAGRMENEQEYFTFYNQMYYASNVEGGFFCLAISPDTLRILAGTNDGEVYIMEAASWKIVQYVRPYEYYNTVCGCHYNPVVGHEEFATCDEDGVLDIWHVEELDDGSEQTASVHRLKLEAGTSCCTYSPDGQLIAVTSAALYKTYIICSHSAEILYTLVYKENTTCESYFLNSSLFVGHSCQVATVHADKSLCFWKLPVIYSLKTLCLLVLRSAVKYNNIDNLPLSTPMKLQLKYLYV